MYPRDPYHSSSSDRNTSFNPASRQPYSSSSPRTSSGLRVPGRTSSFGGPVSPTGMPSTPPPSLTSHAPSFVKPFVMPEPHQNQVRSQKVMDIAAPARTLPSPSLSIPQQQPASPTSLKVPHTPQAAPLTSSVTTAPAPVVTNQPVAPVAPQAPTTVTPPAAIPSIQLPPLDDLSSSEDEPHHTSRLGSFVKFSGIIMGFLTIIIGGAALLNAFVFQSYYVDGLSMQPYLQDDDRLIVSKVERTAAHASGEPYVPKRGQIVVIDPKDSIIATAHREQIIKRIIGLPGETVTIENGVVTVINAENPTGFNIDKALNLKVDPTFSPQSINVTVPAGNVYVLGDNRTEGGSYDSRVFGPVSTDLIIGRLLVRVLPITEVSVF